MVESLSEEFEGSRHLVNQLDCSGTNLNILIIEFYGLAFSQDVSRRTIRQPVVKKDWLIALASNPTLSLPLTKNRLKDMDGSH